MASWQPPIPAGALYSPSALALGPGLALLAWCYDQVERDGCVQIQLEQAAADIGKPYGTLRDWWRDMKGTDEKPSPFFSDVTPQGRKGWRVKFKTKWLDWRIIEKNYPERRHFSDEDTNTVDIPAVNVETEPKDADRADGDVLSDFSSQFDRRDVSDENNVYGTQDSDQAKEVDGAKNSRTSLPKKKPDTPTPKPIREALADVCGIGRISTREQQLQLNQSAAQIWKEQTRAGLDADRTVKDIYQTANYFESKDWRGKKGERPTPAQIREVWVAAHTNGSNGNGKHIRQSVKGHNERGKLSEADTERGF